MAAQQGSASNEAPVQEMQTLSVGSADAVSSDRQQKQNITPWEVEGAVVDGVKVAIDYNKVLEDYGSRPIDAALLERFEKVTGHKPHLFLRRGVFYSHRDLEKILDRHEQGKPFYLYTGRGPSSEHMHLGHVLPFVFCKWLQDVFDVPLVVQLTDDEKFLFRGVAVEQVYKNSLSAVREIAAVGFKPEKTFIFSDLDYVGGAFYRNMLQISQLVTFNQVKAIFGFNDSTCIGRIHFPVIQSAPAFCSSFPDIFGARKDIPCLIPCGVDQDPYFRLTRDVAGRLKHKKPSLIHGRFLPALQGSASKMGSSDPNSAIFMDDSPAKIKNKINRYAFSGGQTSLEEHRALGGNPDVDIPYQYMTYFIDDDKEIADLAEGYRKGEITSGEMKARCITIVQDFIGAFQERERAITEKDVQNFMDPKYPRPFAILSKK
ncbi:tryptophan--tRNA ligase [Coemansia sp. RSA 2399]|nr:tryptophan--tRNA ligase [Coemansia sp. RSA 2399]KAJ1903287.1 tryptophan--tRNA ligase [Coemansia sp. IMI 209127]